MVCKKTKIKNMDNYIGSQQHWEDNINHDYDEREKRNKEQVDNREYPTMTEEEVRKEFTKLREKQKKDLLKGVTLIQIILVGITILVVSAIIFNLYKKL